MSDNIDDKLIEGHEYDGIKELDNPLPRWWLNIFYASIVFAIGYAGYYMVLGGPTHQEQLDASMKAIQSKQTVAMEAAQKKAGGESEEDLNSILNDPAKLQAGATTYATMCASCHGSKGEGLTGPNLTDEFWLHSKGDIKGILTAIREGFPEKGMPAWKAIIPADQHVPLAAYVSMLDKDGPVPGKAPQGEKVTP